MRNLVFIAYLLLSINCSPVQDTKQLEVSILDGEYWWSGLSSLGYQTPYDKNSVTSIDQWGNNFGNQAQPILLSSKGRYIWSEEPLKFEFDKGKLSVSVREGQIVSGTSGDNLKSAFQFAVANFFPPDQKLPAEIMFTQPQYNTWIELTYDQNEADILKYAQAIVDNGYPPGVLMIDDNWQEDYGVLDFSPRRFTDPKGMIAKLHDLGFQVMLWVCPFVSPDSEEYRKLAQEGLLILDQPEKEADSSATADEKPAIIRWWNGASACLDLSNPEARKWYKEQLDYLVTEYGVDGFKFDAGDADFYVKDIVTFEKGTPNDQTTHFARLGLLYPLNEYRASWKMAGLPLVQRLRDKEHKWEDLQKLIPDMLSQSMMGYAYTCPDMIGGGEFKSFQNLAKVDEELVVRSAQVHALMPMMQFSVAPWRVLSEENNKICLQAALLHQQMGDQLLSLAKEASRTGEPIVKPMAYSFPGMGYETLKDQFVLGADIIVAPVVEKGARTRTVVLPTGNWRSDEGTIYEGGKSIEIAVPLDRLPYFQKVVDNALAPKEANATTNRTTIYNFTEQGKGKWRVQDDVVMGGRSDSQLKMTAENRAQFSGRVSLENNGGFCSIHQTVEKNPYVIDDKSSAFVLLVKGDGKAYNFRVRTPRGRHSYGYTFPTTGGGDWETISIPFQAMEAEFHGEPVDVSNYAGENIVEMQLLIGNKREETFEILLETIEVI